MKELVSSMEYNVVCEIIQNRDRPDNRFYIGKGKVYELKRIIEILNGTDNRGSFEKVSFDDEGALSQISEYRDRLGVGKVELVIVCGELKPSQIYNLKNILNVEVFDRIRLILEIFSERAHSEEAKLQVELARLKYEIPIVKELIHRTKLGEHPGLFFAGGEYGVDVYLDKIKSRISRIEKELEKIESERAVKRKHRRKSGFYLASIVGYTNAGKSSLLNLLTKKNVIVENRLFSTLSTTTRRVARDEFTLPILFTDTVGFIEDLPHWLIKAFHSTLEEISLSDIVLLVVDISESIEDITRKLKTSYEVLLREETRPRIVVVFNKKDLVSKDEIESKIKRIKQFSPNSIEPYVAISTKTYDGILELAEVISSTLGDTKCAVVKLPVLDSSSEEKREEKRILEWLRNHSTITLFETYSEDGKCWFQIEVEIKEKYVEHARELVSAIGGEVRFT